MPRKYPEDPACRRRRRALRKVEPSDTPCKVPGCDQGRVDEDCCYTHAIESATGRKVFLRNDGVIDDIAIEVARNGERRVGLTWVEFEIACAYMFNDGLTQDEIRERTGVQSSFSNLRLASIRRIQDALRNAA